MTARLTFIHALTALHPGIGQGSGIIDLPIAREKATGIPYLPGSSLKGALRTRCKTRGMQRECEEIFGPDTVDEKSASASMIQFSDQRLLLLPIRSLAGTFAWVTSPYILRRFVRDARSLLQGTQQWAIDVPDVADLECFIATQDKSASKIVVKNQRNEFLVYLEDLDLVPSYHLAATAWAKKIAEQVFPQQTGWQQMLQDRFCLVSDDVLDFLLETATEITTRIRLQEESKTVEEGGLWYEEALPAETILHGLTLAIPTLDEARGPRRTPDNIFSTVHKLIDEPIQLGGKATVGRGLCQVHFEGSAR